MIRLLAQGKLFGAPMRRVGKNGGAFTTARLKTDTGFDQESTWLSIIAFDDAGERLADLPDRTSVSVSGTANFKTYNDKNGTARIGIDVSVDQIAALPGKPAKPSASQAIELNRTEDVAIEILGR